MTKNKKAKTSDTIGDTGLTHNEIIWVFSELIITTLASFISNSYKKRPIITTLSIAILILIFATSITLGMIFSPPSRNDAKVPELKEQVAQLDSVEKALNDLQSFISSQKNKLAETEKTVNKLNQEKNNLEEVVNLNRKSIDAIFSLQEERNSHSVWKERLIGFGLGVVSSIVASIIILVFQSIRKRNKVLPL